MSKKKKTKIFVCTQGKKCPGRGSEEVFCAFEKQLAASGIRAKLVGSKCLKMCKKGPAVVVGKKREYKEVKPSDVAGILDEIRERQGTDGGGKED